MDSALLGFLVVFGIWHAMLITIPIMDILRSSLPLKSKAVWSLFLLLLPMVGIGIYYLKYKSSLSQESRFEISAENERARAGTLPGGKID
ncbi:MAG: hypothetical protein GKR95_06505 [Gammaproteobacteria bacterium]|nr:hypothetical protein [Gammaproteobacteria bacterium]